MPEHGCIGMTMSQFNRQEALTAIQLFGQFNTGIYRRINKLHGLKSIFSITGFKRWQRLIFRMMLFVIPFPNRRKGKP